jgi:heptosyltransferase-1
MNEQRNFRRILLIRRKALGDALVTMRAVLEVARAWPDASIDLVIDRPFVPLLKEMAARSSLGTDLNVVSWPLPEGGSWLGFLRGGGYDLVVDWLGSPRTALWTLLTGAPVRVGYDLPRRRWAYNIKVPRNRMGDTNLRGFAGEAFLDPLRCLGQNPPPWRDGFAQEGEAGNAVHGTGLEFRTWLKTWTAGSGPPIAMMLSATWSAKSWPAEHAVTLFQDFRARGYNPVIVTGPGDDILEEKLRGLLPADAFAPPTTLLELGHLLGCARVFVGTDCGPRHLAASLGVPTVTMFGATDPIGWNPAVPDHVSVRMDLDCSPCDLADCPLPGHPCMAGLTPGMVMEATERLLRRDRNGKAIW